MSELITRLRMHADNKTKTYMRHDCAEAADHIEAQDEKIRVLREALSKVYVSIGQGGGAYEINQRTRPVIRDALEKTK